MLDCNRLSAITQCAQYRYINVHYCDFIRIMPRIILEFDVKHYDQLLSNWLNEERPR